MRFGYVVGENKFKFNRQKKKPEFQAGFTGYVFYQGHKPATTMPTQIVKYEGHWELNRKEKNKPMGLTATFNADFGSKKLTGSLTSNGEAHVSVQKIKERYKIDADIKGNRFVGSATANEKTHTIFGEGAKNRLEGGFFGPKAEELAGKFLTDDNSLFVVFGAKRERWTRSAMLAI
ncbi:transferrin-binding protein-like solute binding protein [Histophilus somni]|uniref:transferrin-binding protein-like solute binding protein n=1 Tax=Histophilus somni TaxID=731 RepID=UPI001E35F5D2|nr:transferrin-binding protein-like solute binding protein [Histophilus somni]